MKACWRGVDLEPVAGVGLVERLAQKNDELLP